MNENIKLILMLDDGTGKMYDDVLAAVAIPQASPMTIVTKDKGTKKGRPCVLITFDVLLPNNKIMHVQATTTARLFITAASAIQARHEQEDGHG